MSERRGKLEELSTIHRVYGEASKAPEIQVASKEFGGQLEPGDVVTVFDSAGNEVRAEVKRILVAVVPDWETWRNTRVERTQETLA